MNDEFDKLGPKNALVIEGDFTVIGDDREPEAEPVDDEIKYAKPEFGDPPYDALVRIKVQGMVASGVELKYIAMNTPDDMFNSQPMDLKRFKRVFANEIAGGVEGASARMAGLAYELAFTAKDKADGIRLKAALEWLSRRDSKRWSKAMVINSNLSIEGQIKVKHDIDIRLQKMEDMLDGLGRTKYVAGRADFLEQAKEKNSGRPVQPPE
jgi:hypothetical protein